MMNTNIKFYSLLIILYGAWLLSMYQYTGRIDIGIVIVAFFGMIITLLLVAAVKGIIWRVKNGVDLLATLETDPEAVKEHMLFIMQYGHSDGIKGALMEFNDIFRNYPQWELAQWVVFRAWYKQTIDHALENSELYVLTMKDGSEYNKENDPLYDASAPDWTQFDCPHYYDDDNEEEDDDEIDRDNKYRKSAEEGFYLGIGLGATDNSLNK